MNVSFEGFLLSLGRGVCVCVGAGFVGSGCWEKLGIVTRLCPP